MLATDPECYTRFVAGLFKALLSLLCVFGIGARLVPLLDATRRMAQWPTEDGYFMLTMGRNVALGRGLSVAGGEMPTNGTQPLTTLIWALGYATVDGDRESGVLIALVLQWIAAMLTAFAIYRLGKTIFAERSDGSNRAALAAAVWLASPVVMPHTMNCLETGFNGLIAVLVAHTYVSKDGLWSWKRTLGFGALLGVAFWVRNDSAFLIAAACLGYLLPALRTPEERTPRFLRVLVFGATSVAVASPWLVYNYVNFGHIMPVSGRAEALTGHFGGNLAGVPIVLAEYLMAFVPIPHSVSDSTVVVLGAAALIFAALAVLIVRRRELHVPERRLAFLVGVYLLGMAAFYGLYFGAAWFLPRYFLPLSPFLALAFSSVVFLVLGRLADRLRSILALGGAVAMLGIIAFVGYRQYRGGTQHMHFQVVAWVEENVPEETWIGAIQTGTLGFFHDRTINLDGKVNIAAYEALVAGREGEYVVEDTEIQYLADWIGMRDWLTKPVIAANFEVVVEDEDANLAVLRRRTPQ